MVWNWPVGETTSEVDKALEKDGYIQGRWDILNKYNLKCFAISNHLVGQCVADDPIDERHQRVLPPRLWGDGDPEGVRQRCAEEMKNTAIAAKKLGVGIVNGFTGSKVWKNLYFFPPTNQDDINKGYADFAARWKPILDVYSKNGIKYALEVHPTEIAYDLVTAKRALEAIGNHPAFGFNFDPSHFIHQFINPVEFINDFGEHIFHVHVKDSRAADRSQQHPVLSPGFRRQRSRLGFHLSGPRRCQMGPNRACSEPDWL